MIHTTTCAIYTTGPDRPHLASEFSGLRLGLAGVAYAEYSPRQVGERGPSQ